jgi:hypothetical protein
VDVPPRERPANDSMPVEEEPEAAGAAAGADDQSSKSIRFGGAVFVPPAPFDVLDLEEAGDLDWRSLCERGAVSHDIAG